MQAYGIRLTYYNEGRYEDSIATLAAFRESIDESIGLDSVIGTRAYSSLEETFFIVTNIEDATKAVIGIPVAAGGVWNMRGECVPLTFSEEPDTYQKAEIIDLGGHSSPLT